MPCNGRCFGYQCRECDEGVYRDEFDQAMHENYQDHYVDIAEREYEYETKGIEDETISLGSSLR